jgi:hypothetical protein
MLLRKRGKKDLHFGVERNLGFVVPSPEHSTAAVMVVFLNLRIDASKESKKADSEQQWVLTSKTMQLMR